MIAQRIAALLVVLFMSVAASADEVPPADDCIRSWGAARFNGSGYSHRVHVRNSCAAPADCVVTTDVNPKPTMIVVPPVSEIEVSTFLDSPWSTFMGRVECTMPTTQ